MTDFVACPTCRGTGLLPLDLLPEADAADRERMVERVRADLAALEAIVAEAPCGHARGKAGEES